MSIASEITRINTNIANSYTAVDNKNGTLPQVQNSANLASAIDSIEVIESATAEGESINLANTKAMPYSDYVVEGKSEQETRSGKNLANSLNLTEQEINGVTQYININGKATARADYKFVNYVTYNANLYDIQKGNDNAHITVMLVARSGSVVDSTTSSKHSFNLSQNKDCLVWIRIYNDGYTINNQKIYPQVKLSSITDDTYEPYGVSPSPDYPSEIHSVADDVNLLENMTIYNSNHYISPLLKLNPGTYTFNYTGDSAPGIYIRKNDGSNPTNGTVVDQKYIANNITFSISETGNYYIHLYSSTIWEQLTMNNPKLQKGTEATPYSPYNQGTVTIKQRGKNCIDTSSTTISNGVTSTQNSDGSITSTGTTTGGYFNITNVTSFKLPAGTYTFSINSARNYLTVLTMKNANNTDENKYIGVGNKSITFTTTEEKVRFFVWSYSTNGVEINETISYQLEQGSTATSYEPYQGNDYTFQTEPLRSLPNGVKDTIETEQHRKIGRQTGTLSQTTTITLSDAKTNGAYMCNIKPSGTLTGKTIELEAGDYEIIYELEEIIEPLTQNQATTMLDIIKTGSYEGTTNIYTDEDVKPTMKVDYYKRS